MLRLSAIAACLSLAVAGAACSTTSSDLDTGAEDYVRWMRAFIALEEQEREAIDASGKVARQVGEANAPFPTIHESAVEARAMFAQLRERVETDFPRVRDPRVEEMNRFYLRSLRHFENAMDAVVKSVKLAPSKRAARLVDRYNAERRRGARQVVRMAERTVHLYFAFGGEEALGERLPLAEIRKRHKP